MAISTEGTYQDFAYTGGVQTFTVPYTGLYKLEVWGAGNWQNGGYSLGYKTFKKNQKIYIACGKAGGANQTSQSFNGGGKVNYNSETTHYAGSGATHMALVTGELKTIGYTEFVTNSKGLIVAGGAGGRCTFNNNQYSGGSGGGLTGGGGHSEGYGVTTRGGGQTEQTGGWDGAFGQGKDNPTSTGGGGGGGFYGGGCEYYSPGAGGSGWIGGVPKITYKGTTYSPSTTNGNNSGNGKARITLVKKGFPTIIYNGVTLEGLNFNGTEVDTVVFNGVTLE